MIGRPKYHYFQEAITLWLVEKGYVTLQATEEDRSFITKLLGTLKHMYVSLSTPAQIVKTTSDLMTHGFTSETAREVIKMIKNISQQHNKLTRSLRPVISGSMQHFRQLSNLVAYRLDWRYNLLVITVTFADDLDLEQIWDQCGRMVKVPYRLTTMRPQPGNPVLI
jgi:hypothetical protein